MHKFFVRIEPGHGKRLDRDMAFLGCGNRIQPSLDNHPHHPGRDRGGSQGMPRYPDGDNPLEVGLVQVFQEALDFGEA